MSDNPGDSLLEREDVGGVTVLRVQAPLLRDDETSEALFREVLALLDEPGDRKLVLNLAPVEFLASVAVGKLGLLHRKARGRLVLCQVRPTLDRTLEAARLADVLAIFSDEGEAVRSFA